MTQNYDTKHNAAASLRLGLELVPSPCHYENLRKHAPRHWKRIRNTILKEAGKRCIICGEKATECHEKWHYNFILRKQTLVGLEALCKRCHEVRHFLLAERRGNGQRAFEHLCKINGLDDHTANEYVEDETTKCNRMSFFDWTIEFNYAEEKFGILLPPVRTRLYADEMPSLCILLGKRRGPGWLLYWFLMGVRRNHLLKRALTPKVLAMLLLCHD